MKGKDQDYSPAPSFTMGCREVSIIVTTPIYIALPSSQVCFQGLCPPLNEIGVWQTQDLNPRGHLQSPCFSSQHCATSNKFSMIITATIANIYLAYYVLIIVFMGN